MTLADRIKDARKEKGYTQKDLADLISVKSSTVSGWELGRNEPSIETLKKIAVKLDVDFDYLAGVDTKASTHKRQIDLKKEPVVLSYDGKPATAGEMDIIKAILERHRKN